MKQFIQSILVAAIFLIGLNHSVSSENNQRVYAVDLEAHLSAAGYKVGKFEGEWEKEDGTRLLFLKKALKKYVLKKYNNMNGIHHWENSDGNVVDEPGTIIAPGGVTAGPATDITNFVYEERLNDSKRAIDIIRNDFVEQIVKEFKQILV